MYSDGDDRRTKPSLMDGCRVSDHTVKLKRVSGLRQVIINEQKRRQRGGRSDKNVLRDSREAPWQRSALRMRGEQKQRWSF